MMRRLLGLVTAAAMLVSAGCHAQPTDTTKATVPLDWKTECVGRYQVSVPGEVEIILPAPRALNSKSDELIARYLSTSKTFGNQGKEYRNLNFHTYSKFLYLGDIGITVEVPEIDFDDLRKMYKGRKQYYLKNAPLKEKEGYSATADDYREKAANERPLDYDQKNMFGWDFKGGSLIYLYKDSRIFILDLNFQVVSETTKNVKKSVDSFLQAFRSRPLHEIPIQPGVCIPYGFIADDGKADRSVAVTMRLKNHPDVEVFFHDKSGDLSSGSNEPKDNIEYFWTKMYRDFAKLLEADSRKYYKVKMGEQDGTAMFVTITRHDGSKDYGYIAIVKGDPTAATDTPSQMLYVIRTAKRTKGKPVSKDELKDIAEQITASVKRHAVQ